MYRRKCCNPKMQYYKEEEIENKCDYIQNIMDTMDECDCGYDETDNTFPENPMFGQSYVPIQIMNKTFTPEVGLRKGTIFPELVDPYVPCQSMEEIAYLAANNKIGEGCNKCQMN